MKVLKPSVVFVALSLSVSVHAKSWADNLIGAVVDKVVNTINTAKPITDSRPVDSSVLNGYLYATPNDTGDLGSSNSDGVEVTTDLNNDGAKDKFALMVKNNQADELYLYSNISGSDPTVSSIFKITGSYNGFQLVAQKNNQIKITLLSEAGDEINVLATYDAQKSDFEINHYAYANHYGDECGAAGFVTNRISLNFDNGVFNKEMHQCIKKVEIKKDEKVVEVVPVSLSEGINAIDDYVRSISPN